MSDTFGGLTLPMPAASATEQPGDRVLGPLSGFFAAILNAYASTAWASVAPATAVPVRKVYTHDPTDYVFNESDLPALYVTRTGGKAEWLADDWEMGNDTITAWWVFPPAQQANQRARDNITNGVVKALQAATARTRDAAWSWAADTDPTAATLAAAPAAVRLSHATPTSPATYSGASLDGLTGAGVVSPPRPMTLTLGGTVGAWTVGSALTVTYLDRLGFSHVEAFTVGTVPQAFATAYDATRVSSVAVDAQAATTGTLSVGLGAFTGRGSDILTVAGLTSIYLATWKDRLLPIQMSEGAPVRTYDCVEMIFDVRDKLTLDPTDSARYSPQGGDGHGPLITYTREDGTAIESSDLPQDGS